MKERIEIIITHWNELEKQKKEYLNNRKQEQFVDSETKEENELLLQAENILDRKLIQKERIDNIFKLNEKLKIIGNSIFSEIIETENWIEEENQHLKYFINEIYFIFYRYE